MSTETATFDDIADEFRARVERIVWCTVATVDNRGRPRSRILHPLWEGPTGWILTGRESHKAAHLQANEFVSCSYWDQDHHQVYADCRAHWADDLAERERAWRLFAATPPPVGYDPALFWPDGPGDAGYGLLRLDPWRIELFSLEDLITGTPPLVWRP
jgi:general stress protein 26